MINPTDALSKKVTVITGVLVAITGLLAAWVSFIKVMNPEPPEEKKAQKAYQVLKEKLEFQEMVLTDTRAKINDLEMKLWLSLQLGTLKPSVVPENPPQTTEEPAPPITTQTYDTAQEIAPAIIQRQPDALLSRTKDLPKKL